MRSPKPRSSAAAGSSAHGRSTPYGSALVAVLLGKTALFGALEHDDRIAVAGQMHRAAFEPGQTVFGRGDAGSDVYLVVRGRVRLSVFSFDGRLLSFKHADARDIFGEIAALDGGPRTADAIALTRVEAMTLAQDRLNRLIKANPRVARAVTDLLTRIPGGLDPDPARAEEVVRFCAQHGLRNFEAWAKFGGRAMIARRGDAREGLAVMRAAVDAAESMSSACSGRCIWRRWLRHTPASQSWTRHWRWSARRSRRWREPASGGWSRAVPAAR